MHRPLTTLFAVLAFSFSLVFGSGTARSQEPSPDAVAAARELVTTARLADNFRKIIPVMVQQMMQQLKPAVVQGHPEAAADYDAIAPQMAEGILARGDRFIDGIARIYAQHFTADELKQLTAFYRTPAGQKYIDQLPTITQESMSMGQALGQEIGKDIHDRMIEELRKRGHNI